jgi:hypothetical protein
MLVEPPAYVVTIPGSFPSAGFLQGMQPSHEAHSFFGCCCRKSSHPHAPRTGDEPLWRWGFNEPFHCQFPYLAHIRTFGLKLAGSGNVSEHSSSDLRRILSAEFTKTVCGNPHVARVLSLSPVVLLKIEGKCAGFRAKSVHISGHLPSSKAGI